MPVFSLSPQLVFPPVHLAEPDGLLAIGGDLSPNRLLLAYQSGIFPWFSPGEPILWWSPDPRFVLQAPEVVLSKSMKQVLRRNVFRITFDQAFEEVIRACAKIPRAGQRGTWITTDMQKAYLKLHELGYAHSVEAWQDDRLVGGLYGVSLGSAFFGESMFAKVSNASKAAFLSFALIWRAKGHSLIDCQVPTEHLASLGAREVDRELFLDQLRLALEAPTHQGSWGYWAPAQTSQLPGLA